jgi:hypothetical protein
MIRGLLTVLAFISVLLFPWPFTVLLVLVAAFFEPLVPLAIGIFADTLYYTPHAGAFPVLWLYGALLTGVAYFVRSRIKTSIIGG